MAGARPGRAQDACVLTLALPPVICQSCTLHPTFMPHFLSSFSLFKPNGILHGKLWAVPRARARAKRDAQSEVL